jgi:hypothetical protein
LKLSRILPRLVMGRFLKILLIFSRRRCRQRRLIRDALNRSQNRSQNQNRNQSQNRKTPKDGQSIDLPPP